MTSVDFYRLHHFEMQEKGAFSMENFEILLLNHNWENSTVVLHLIPVPYILKCIHLKFLTNFFVTPITR